MDLLAREGRRPRAALLLAAALLAGSAATLPSSAASPGLTQVRSAQLSARLVELTFTTPALAQPTRARVLLPTGYAASRQRYPVLYLLNGGAGSYLDWTVLGDAERITAGLPLIVVMPDGGTGGNYTDWYGEDGSGQRPLWETYHVRQLLPWVDRHFRTTGARAVAGMSMGGNGALHYAGRHPHLFAAAASFSGAVDVLDPVMTPVTETTGVVDGALPGAVFGPRLTQEVRWRASNPIDLAANLRRTWVSLATGDGSPGGPDGGGVDPLERVVHEENVALHQRLTELGIPHGWDDYGPGGHVWFYWQRELRDVLPPLLRVLRRARPVPTSVTHWAVEPSYDVWGWSVRLRRPVLEASELVDAGVRGFVLRGTGTAVVTTPALYRPHQRLAVRVADEAGTRVLALRAGQDRRLQVAVDLGPGNALQQHTVPTQPLGTAVREARVAVS